MPNYENVDVLAARNEDLVGAYRETETQFLANSLWVHRWQHREVLVLGVVVHTRPEPDIYVRYNLVPLIEEAPVEFILQLTLFSQEFKKKVVHESKQPRGVWLPIQQAPKDGTEVDLYLCAPWCDRRASMVWYSPWERWVQKDAIPENPNDENLERHGVGSALPTHFMYPPDSPE